MAYLFIAFIHFAIHHKKIPAVGVSGFQPCKLFSIHEHKNDAARWSFSKLTTVPFKCGTVESEMIISPNGCTGTV
jgi:hypothetical protein